MMEKQLTAPTSNVMRNTTRTLTDEEKFIVENIKAAGRNFHTYLESLGSSRELSIAKTKIEEAVMWAVKGVTA